MTFIKVEYLFYRNKNPLSMITFTKYFKTTKLVNNTNKKLETLKNKQEYFNSLILYRIL